MLDRQVQGHYKVNKKPLVFVLSQLPPPVHGASIMNQIVVNSKYLRNRFHLHIIPMQLSRRVDDIGRFSVRKIFRTINKALFFFVAAIFKKPDLAYITLPPNGLAFYAGCIFIFIAKTLRVRRIIHLHGKGISTSASSAVTIKVYRWALSNAKIILLSPRLSSDVSGIIQKSNIAYLPNAIGQIIYSNNKPLAQSTKIKILFLSSMVLSKGPVVLLKALAYLAQEGHDFEAIFAGPPSSDLSASTFQNKIEELQLGTKATYLGKVSGDAKSQAFQSADIFVLPSFYANEAFPVVLLEAMSYGLPIISTNEGAIADIVCDNENGIIVDKNSVESLAAAIRGLLEDPGKRERFSKNALLHYNNHYTLDKFETGMAKIWDKTLQG